VESRAIADFITSAKLQSVILATTHGSESNQ